MNMKLSKPLLSLIILTGITAALFSGVGTAPMMADTKVSDSPHNDAVMSRSITTTSINEGLSVECGVGDKMWQPAVWNTKRAQDTRLTVSF